MRWASSLRRDDVVGLGASDEGQQQPLRALGGARRFASLRGGLLRVRSPEMALEGMRACMDILSLRERSTQDVEKEAWQTSASRRCSTTNVPVDEKKRARTRGRRLVVRLGRSQSPFHRWAENAHWRFGRLIKSKAHKQSPRKFMVCVAHLGLVLFALCAITHDT